MIDDVSEFTLFPTFSDVGVKTTDTFNVWRKKTNGLVQLIGALQENSTDSESPITFDFTNVTLRIKTDGIKTINIENSAVTGDKIANLTITEGKLATNSVTESKIFTGAVTEAKIGSGAVTEAKIGTGAVSTLKLANQAVTETKIGPLAVTETKIGDLAVTETKIGVEAVTEAKIGFRAVTTEKIGTQAVTTPKIQDLSVVETKLADLSVTNAKIGAVAVSEGKIQNGAVTTDKLASQAVTAGKLSGGQASGNTPIYGIRAWCKFSPYVGASASAAYKNGSYTRSESGTAVTGMANHGLKENDVIYLRALTGSFNNSLWTVISVQSNSAFTVNHTGSASSGTIEAQFITIRGSGNISTATRTTNGGAGYAFNFIEPMPNNQYALVGTSQHYPGSWYDYLYEEMQNGTSADNTRYQCFARTYHPSRFANIMIIG